MTNWRLWTDAQIEDYIEAHEDTEDDSMIQLLADMEKELYLREDMLDPHGAYAEMYPHTEHVGLDMPEGYGA